jgi:signal transduction histidine kinase/CheY-like chemotaxis protein
MTKSWAIITLPIETENDVVGVRQRARHIAELLGFERQDQTRIATAVSEIARNAFAYAGGGLVEFSVVTGNPQLLRIRIRDRGPGIADLPAVLDGRRHPPGGGLVGARRLMDCFSVESAPSKGTVVELGQHLPRTAAKVTPTDLSKLAVTLRTASSDPLAALREQNRELLRSLEEIRRRDEETKDLNQELSDTNRGVVALYAELDGRAEQLRQASELKSRFLSNMSHEFRTPLNSVIALSRMLLDHVDGDLTSEQERQVGLIRRSAEDLLEMVNDLLDLAKVEAGKVEINLTRVSVPSLFGSLRGSLRPLLTRPSVELIFERADDMPDISTDEAKLVQILRNLISNALKFTETGEVVVSARHDADSGLAIFSVRDTGIGIAPENHERIFEEFSQIDSQLQKKVKGTGLGLPLSRSLAQLIGGEIRLESVPGQGSVFTLTVPTTLAGAVEKERSTGGNGHGPKRILVIDDDETFRYVIRQIISNDPSYEVIEASDGGDGLQLVHDKRPDAVILDLQMPNIDGFAVLKELAADRELAAIPVIVSTSLAVDASLRERLPSGVRLIPKDQVSRASVSQMLRETVMQPPDGPQ